MAAWRFAPHNHVDQADIGRQSFRLFRPRGLSAAPLGERMFDIYLGERKIGTTLLEYGDPPMGVAWGKVELVCAATERVPFLESLRAERDGEFLVIRNNPLLHAVDSNGVKVGSEFCALSYFPELEEGEFEAYAIDACEYQSRFPSHVEAYENQFKE